MLININGQQIETDTLSLPQLKAIDSSIEYFLFSEIGGEPFETSFKKDPKQFKKLINLMISFKGDVMGYFRKQFLNRYNLIQWHVIKLDQYDDFFFDDQWDQEEKTLSVIIEKYSSQGYDLGVIALALSLGVGFDYGYQEVQKYLLKRSEKIAGDITTTTRNRVKTQIKAAMDLGESREEFDARLKKVFVNPYRGRFIAQQESLNSYMEGKEGLAKNQELTYKTALSSQAKDLICGTVNGETVPVDEPFSNGFFKPLFHYGCRCDISYHRDPDF